MNFSISWETVISAATVLGALAVIWRYINKFQSWFLRQEAQDRDIAAMKEENTLIVYGLLACLKGLHEQGCDGPVDDAINRLEKYLNKKAHQ